MLEGVISLRKPLHVRGYMTTGTFDGSVLTMTGSTAMARVGLRGGQHAEGPLVVHVDDVVALWQRPQRFGIDVFVNGCLELTLRDGTVVQLHYRPRKQRAGFDALATALRDANPAIRTV